MYFFKEISFIHAQPMDMGEEKQKQGIEAAQFLAKNLAATIVS